MRLDVNVFRVFHLSSLIFVRRKRSSAGKYGTHTALPSNKVYQLLNHYNECTGTVHLKFVWG